MGNHSKKTSQIRLGIDYRSPDTVCLPTISNPKNDTATGGQGNHPKKCLSNIRKMQLPSPIVGSRHCRSQSCARVVRICPMSVPGFSMGWVPAPGGGGLGSTKLGKHTVGYPIWIIFNYFYILSQFEGPIWWKICLKTIWDKMKMQFLISDWRWEMSRVADW